MKTHAVVTIAIAGAVVLGLSLGGCSAGSLPGGVPGSNQTGAAAGSGSGGSGGSGGCTASGTTIPAGHYSGTIKAILKSTMTLTIPGAGTISNAGSGTESMKGTVDIVSNGSTVSGTMSLEGLGFSQIAGGIAGSSDTGAFAGQITGSAGNPIVNGKLSGEWDSYGPVTTSSGSATNSTSVGLHVTSASCSAVSGNAIAMFAQIAAPVAKYISISGSGLWTAKRQ